MNVSRETLSRDELVRAARGWIGVPWRRHGRSRHGVDCGGLLFVMAHELGLGPFPDIPPAERTWPQGFLLRMFRSVAVERPVASRLAHGVVGVFMNAGRARHAGVIALDGPRPSLIHASFHVNRARRCVLEESLEPWLKQLVTTFDFPQVTREQ